MAFPTDIPFRSLNFTSNVPTMTAKSLSGVEQRAIVAGQYFSFTGNFSALTEAQRKKLFGYLMSQKGSYSSFAIALPEPLNDSTGNYTGTITVATASAGVLQVTAAVSANNTLIVKAGDLIKFSGHNKVYMVTADATSNGSGSVDIEFFPPLRTAISTSNTVAHKDVEMTVKLSDPNFGFSMTQDMYANFDIGFIEVLS